MAEGAKQGILSSEVLPGLAGRRAVTFTCASNRLGHVGLHSLQLHLSSLSTLLAPLTARPAVCRDDGATPLHSVLCTVGCAILLHLIGKAEWLL